MGRFSDLAPPLQTYARMLASESSDQVPNDELATLADAGAVVPSASGEGWRARHPRFVMQMLSVQALREGSPAPFVPLGGAPVLCHASDVLDVHASPLGSNNPLDTALTHLELTCAYAKETYVAMLPRPAAQTVTYVEALCDVLRARGISVSIVLGGEYLGSEVGQQLVPILQQFGVSVRSIGTSALPDRNVMVADDGTCGLVWDHTTKDIYWTTSNPSLNNLVTHFSSIYAIAEPLIGEPRDTVTAQVSRLPYLELVSHIHHGATLATMARALYVSRATIERRIATLHRIFGTSTMAELTIVTKAFNLP